MNLPFLSQRKSKLPPNEVPEGIITLLSNGLECNLSFGDRNNINNYNLDTTAPQIYNQSKRLYLFLSSMKSLNVDL